MRPVLGTWNKSAGNAVYKKASGAKISYYSRNGRENPLGTKEKSYQEIEIPIGGHSSSE